ncbi:MAG: lipoyl synthase [Candidatus Omnitrophica bacterium]|nr:lipoyl synthase [Candidatus Omnitrophota bacterium]
MPRAVLRISTETRRLPDWLRKSVATGQEAAGTDSLLRALRLHTICESGRCPNRDECYSQKTATFMILGDVCTRSCGFCSVSTGRPGAVDGDEPRRIAEAVRRLALRHVVVTSVNRDDLVDEGADHFVRVIRRLREIPSRPVVEILTPDFRRTQKQAVAAVAAARPDIFGHNVETVPRLYRRARPQADYGKTLEIFREIRAVSDKILTKSGLMVGLGESGEEVLRVMRDLREAGCRMLTIGQYLQSSGAGLPVEEYVAPSVFAEYKQAARETGFDWVESAPFVRSSFHARESFEALEKLLRG